jgi:hypothetical protein
MKWITLAGVILIMLLLSMRAFGQDARVVKVAQAIARAEGFYQNGTIPNRCHNAGDLKGTNFVGEVGLCKGGHAKFKNDAYGWSALYNQLEKMISGQSHVYRVNMTFREVSRLYAGNSRVWLNNVTRVLSVSPEDTVTSYLNRDYVTPSRDDWDFSTEGFE